MSCVRGRRARRGESGAIAVEFMLVMGVLVGVFLLMLQYAVRAHADRIATAAAEEALAATAAYDGSEEAGRRVARALLTDLGPGVKAPQVSVRRGATTARVLISGEVEQLVPFLTVTVEAEVEGPVERWVP